jgi:hypothetical protein
VPAVFNVAGPLSVDVVLVVSTLFGMVQGVHPVPVTWISATAEEKPLPLIVKVNVPVVGELGFVVRLETDGVGAMTVKGKALELPPPLGLVAFTVQLSGSFIVVIVIRNCVLLTKVTCDPDSVVEPPVHVTKSVGAFTKPVPLIVMLWALADPVTGFGLTLVIVGAVIALVTVTFVPPDCGPAAPLEARKPFCTTKL